MYVRNDNPAPAIATIPTVQKSPCGCGCGGKKPAAGLGLFNSTDFAQWGIAEWAAVAFGGYLAIKLFGDLTRAKSAYQGHKRRRARKRELREAYLNA